MNVNQAGSSAQQAIDIYKTGQAPETEANKPEKSIQKPEPQESRKVESDTVEISRQARAKMEMEQRAEDGKKLAEEEKIRQQKDAEYAQMEAQKALKNPDEGATYNSSGEIAG